MGANQGKGALQSMTGYSRVTKRTAAGSMTVELRSTNHRFLEIDQRLPNGLTSLQARLNELIRKEVRRGRIEVWASLRAPKNLDRRHILIDDFLLQRYYEALVDLKNRFGLKGPVTLEQLLAIPDAIKVAEERLPAEAVWEPLSKAVREAVRELVRSRRREGAKLASDLRAQTQAIERHVNAVMRGLPKAMEQQRRRMRDKFKQLLGSKANVSLSQVNEALSLVKEADVHEEFVRLRSHLSHIRQTLSKGTLIGKQLDFIAQELMRETNTMGAKVDDAEAARHVVEIKGCIEKIREQAQNLE